MRRGEQELGEAAEVVFEGLLAEGDSGEAEKVVLEVVEIPGNRLAIEAGAGIADFVVQIAPGFDLKAGQGCDNLSIRFDAQSGQMTSPVAIRAQEFEERDVAEVFLEVGICVPGLRRRFPERAAVSAKVAGELEEGYVLFAHRINDADGAATASPTRRTMVRPEPPSCPWSGIMSIGGD